MLKRTKKWTAAILSLVALVSFALVGTGLLFRPGGVRAEEYRFTFEDGTDTSALILDGGWVVADGALKRTEGTGDAFVRLTGAGYRDTAVEFKYKITGDAGTKDYSLSYFSRNTAADNWLDSARVMLRAPDWNAACNFLQVYAAGGDVLNGTSAPSFTGFAVGTEYTVKIVVVGTRVQAYVNGGMALDGVLPKGASGAIGFNSWNQYCEIDDLTIREAVLGDLTETATEKLTYTFEDAGGTGDTSLLQMGNGWAVADGVLKRTTGGGDGFVWLNGAYFKDAAFTFKLKFTGRENDDNKDYNLSVITRNSSENWQKSNFVTLRPTDYSDGGGCYLEAYSQHGDATGNPVKSAGVMNDSATAFAGFTRDTVYQVKTVFVGNRVQVAVDGAVVLDALVPEADAGRIGFGSWRAYCEIDDLAIAPAAAADLTAKNLTYHFDETEETGDRSAIRMDNGWGVADGVLKRTTGGGDGFVWFDGAYYDDAAVRFKFKMTGSEEGNKDYGLTVISKNSKSDNWQMSNRVILRAPDWGVPTPANAGFVERYSGYDNSLNGGMKPNFTGFEIGTQYDVKVVFFGTRVQAVVDGAIVLDVSVPEGRTGRIGLNSWRAYCEIDDLAITPATQDDITVPETKDEYRFDFADGSNVTALERDGGWIVSDGVLKRASGSGDGFVWLANEAWTDAAFEFDYKVTGDSGDKNYALSLVARNTDSADWQASDRITMRAPDWSPDGTAQDAWTCLMPDSQLGAVSGTAKDGFTGFAVGTTYHIKAIFSGGYAQVFVDGALTLDAVVPVGAAGRIGINSWNQYAEIDNLVLRKPQAYEIVKDSYAFDFAADTPYLERDGGWNVSDGVLKRDSGTGDGFVWLKGNDFVDSVFTFKLKMTGDAGTKNYALSLITRNTGTDNWMNSNRVIMRAPDWSPDNTAPFGGNFTEAYSGLGAVENGGMLAGFTGFGLGETYTVKAVFVGAHAQVFVDDVLVLDASVPEGTAGNLGVNSWNAYCEIDDLTIRKGAADDVYVAPPPVHQDSYTFDFADGSDVSVLQMDGGWTVSDGVLKRASGEGDAFVWLKGEDYIDTVFEFKLKLTGDSGNKDCGLSLFSRNQDTADWSKSNWVILRPQDWRPGDMTEPFGSNFIEAYSHISDVVSGAADFTGFTKNRFYTLKIAIVKNKIEVTVDGVKVLDTENNSEEPGFTGGNLGFNAWNVYCEIDDLTIRRGTDADVTILPDIPKKDCYTFDFSEGSEENAALTLGAGWGIADGVLKRTSEEGDSQVFLRGNTEFTNAVTEFKFKMTGDADNKHYAFNVLFRKTGEGWQNSNNVTLRAPDWHPDGMSGPIGMNYIELYNNRTASPVEDGTNFMSFTGFQVGREYDVKILMVNNRVRVYVDDVLSLDAVSRAHRQGEIGFNSFNAYVEVDNLTVRVATADEVAAMPEAPEREQESGGPNFIDPGREGAEPAAPNGGLYLGLAIGGAALALLGVGFLTTILVLGKRRKATSTKPAEGDDNE